MKLSPLLALAAFTVGCGGYINNGAPPAVAIDHPLRVEIAVTGATRDTTLRALEWVLGGTHQVSWVKSGGDARLLLKSALTEDHEMLGGTACTLRVELSAASGGAEPLLFTRAFKSDPVTSNLAVEKEKLITRGVVWALNQASARLAAPPPPVEPPPIAAPSPVDTPPAAVDTPVEPSPTPPAHHKRHHHRR